MGVDAEQWEAERVKMAIVRWVLVLRAVGCSCLRGCESIRLDSPLLTVFQNCDGCLGWAEEVDVSLEESNINHITSQWWVRNIEESRQIYSNEP